MLIHALFDNKAELENGLTYQLYNGYFNGTDAAPNTSWFDTAELLASGTTANLSSLETATNGTFAQNFNDTEAMNDNWNMSGYTYTGVNLAITTRTNNNIRLTMSSSVDPQLTLEGTRPSVNSSNFKYIHFRYKIVSGAPDFFELFYYNDTLGVAQTRSVKVNYDNITLGQWRNIAIDMSNDANYTSGNWNKYRLDPISGGTAVIDWEYFIISNSIQTPDYNSKSLRISGAFRATKTGTYRFFTSSDDASFLYINGVAVVSNGGIHTAQNRFGNVSLVSGNYYPFVIYYGDSGTGQEFSAGYLEPITDGTTSGSTSINDFTTNATSLNVYYKTNWIPGSGPYTNTLVYTNPSLYGRFKLNLISMYVDSQPFSAGKDDLLYISSPQLFVPGSGSTLLVLHEEPINNDFGRKDYHLFGDDFELDCNLNGTIELIFTRINNSALFQRALLVMQAEKLDPAPAKPSGASPKPDWSICSG